MQRVEVRLHRYQHRLGRLLQGAEDRLTAHDDELVLAGHLGRSREDVLELRRTHLCDLAHDPPTLRLAELPGER